MEFKVIDEKNENDILKNLCADFDNIINYERSLFKKKEKRNLKKILN